MALFSESRKSLRFFMELKFSKSDVNFLNRCKNVKVATYSFGSVYKLILFNYEHILEENIIAFWCINVYGKSKYQMSLDSVQQW